MKATHVANRRPADVAFPRRAFRCPPGGPIAISAGADWPWLWVEVQRHLKHLGYGPATRRTYRTVLRALRSHCRCRPAELTRNHIQSYLHTLGRRRLSASWIAMNISVLRTAFDRCCGQDLLGDRPGPRRPDRLPQWLSRREVREVLDGAGSLRDRLLLGLLYGCGIKVGEACRLRWKDLDLTHQTLAVTHRATGHTRNVRLPDSLLPVLRHGADLCPPERHIFTGRREDAPLSVRMAEYIVQRAARSAGIELPVTAMTLRHCFAVHSLDLGMNIRELQETLGHRHIDTTMRYLRCTPPPDATSPLDLLEESGTPPPMPTREPVDPFEEPLDAEPLLPGDTWTNRVRAFGHALRTRLGPRFLSPRDPPG